jgi:RNA 3'-terminal phosphate cyclase
MDLDASSHTSGDTSSDDTDNASSDLSSGSDMSFLEYLCILLLALSSRANRLVVARMNWHCHTQLLVYENLFNIKYRMSVESFNTLLE